MKLENLTSFFEELAPISFQESYDNSGLVLGDHNSEVTGVLVCLDVDDKAVDFALEQDCQLILSHHPAIFAGIKTFTNDSAQGDILIKAIKNDLALYSSHTNFDSVIGGLSDLLCSKLGLKNVKILKRAQDGNYGTGRYGEIEPVDGEMFIDKLKSSLSLESIRLVGDIPEKISTVAVYNGSYDDDILNELTTLKPITLVTGDLKYHAAQELKHKGIFTIDAGHYGTEKIFVEEMSKLLEGRFPGLKIIRYEGKDIFTYR